MRKNVGQLERIGVQQSVRGKGDGKGGFFFSTMPNGHLERSEWGAQGVFVYGVTATCPAIGVYGWT